MSNDGLEAVGRTMETMQTQQVKSFNALLAFACLCLTLFAFSPTSQAATASANVTAKVLIPITVSKSSDLGFGDVYPDITSVGTVAIDASGNRTAGGAAALGPTAGAAAQFTVSGESNASYVLSLPITPITLNSAASDTMLVDNFISDGTGTLNGAGSQVINVGATLHIGAQQAPGDYTGTFDLTVNYN